MTDSAPTLKKEIIFRGAVEKETRQLEDGRRLYLYRDLKNSTDELKKKKEMA